MKQEHTRNQRRMYRIHKLEEKIHNQDLLIGSLQQENDFLRKRENKLQMIEQMFKNEPVDLSELTKLVKGDKE